MVTLLSPDETSATVMCAVYLDRLERRTAVGIACGGRPSTGVQCRCAPAPSSNLVAQGYEPGSRRHGSVVSRLWPTGGGRMRIGLTVALSTSRRWSCRPKGPRRTVHLARYASVVVAIRSSRWRSLTSHGTDRLGTAVLQTYPCHPLLQANRAASWRRAWPSRVHPWDRPVARAGRARVYGALLRPSRTQHRGVPRILGPCCAARTSTSTAMTGARTPRDGPCAAHPIRCCVGAGPRLLPSRVSRRRHILWMAPAERWRTRRASVRALCGCGSTGARIVAACPSPFTTTSRARTAAVARRRCTRDGELRTHLELGGAGSPADAAIVGAKHPSRPSCQSLLDAGATDIWAPSSRRHGPPARSDGRPPSRSLLD